MSYILISAILNIRRVNLEQYLQILGQKTAASLLVHLMLDCKNTAAELACVVLSEQCLIG